MKPIIIALSSILAAVAAVFAFFSCSKNVPEYGPYSHPEEAAYLMENTRFIVHAGGRLNGETEFPFDGSNSLEGLTNAYENGCRVIELDFNFTSDGHLACIHDWYRQYSSAITDNTPLPLMNSFHAEFTINIRPFGSVHWRNF